MLLDDASEDDGENIGVTSVPGKDGCILLVTCCCKILPLDTALTISVQEKKET